MKSAPLALAVLLIAFAAIAQESEEPPIEVEPALMFNQHLYYGTFSRPHALAVDAAHNEVYVADSGNGLIGIFRPDGAELYSFSSKDYLRDPARIALSPKGLLLVIEGDRTKIRTFNYRGVYKGDLTLDGLDKKPILGAVAFDASGYLYVADNRTSQVFVYAPDLKLKRQFGSRGGDEGQFMSICAIAIGPDGKTYVLDQQATAVQVFDNQGNFLRGWGRHEMGAENVSLPSGIALDGSGRIYVSDELRHQVKVFDPSGKFLGQFGGLGDGAGQMSFPTDIAIAGDRIYVTERQTSRVQVFEIAPPKKTE